MFKDIDMEKLKNKQYNPKYKPDINNTNFSNDEQMPADSYVPRANREAIKDNTDIFEKFN